MAKFTKADLGIVYTDTKYVTNEYQFSSLFHIMQIGKLKKDRIEFEDALLTDEAVIAMFDKLPYKYYVVNVHNNRMILLSGKCKSVTATIKGLATDFKELTSKEALDLKGGVVLLDFVDTVGFTTVNENGEFIIY